MSFFTAESLQSPAMRLVRSEKTIAKQYPIMRVPKMTGL